MSAWGQRLGVLVCVVGFGAYVHGELGQIKYRFLGDAGYLRCFLAIRLRHGFGGPEVELWGLGFRV